MALEGVAMPAFGASTPIAVFGGLGGRVLATPEEELDVTPPRRGHVFL